VNRWVLGCALMMAMAGITKAQYSGDILGMHDLSPGGISPVKGGLSACLFCHAPHSAMGAKALWSEKLSTTTYTLYTGTLNQEQQPALGSSSNLCLSCHDGTVAVGQTTPYGNIRMQGAMYPQDVFGTSLQGVHPFNFKLPLDQNTPNLWPEVIAGTGTHNRAVKLIDGNVQCTSCHDPHNQNIDPVAQKFLVMDNTGSALCLACHTTDPGPGPMGALSPAGTTRASAARLASAHRPLGALMLVSTSSSTSAPTLANTSAPMSALTELATFEEGEESTSSPKPRRPNPLAYWQASAHALASHKVSKGARVGSYGTGARNGCMSCHMPHNAPGGKSLLAGPIPSVPNMDAATQNCITCHNGSSVVSPTIPNVFAEFAKTGHPFPTTTNKHTVGESTVLNNNRHATCVDCHNPHSSRRSDSLSSTRIRAAQYGAAGISATDGTTVINRATDQYETCLRCHGTSAGKQTLTQFGYLPVWTVSSGDPLNIIPQFSRTATSAHPVMRDRNSPLSQPSLLQYMWNQSGTVQGRAMGTRILCTDCHNSDDNREFGGNGPNGPHGSQYPHILERRYEMSQVAPPPAGGPGSTIQNLFPNPILDPGCSSYPCASPYSMCAKCHDLKNIVSNSSFTQHARHINDGFSCSICHTAHGIGATSASVSGERLVSFDANIVGSNNGAPIAYVRGKGTCTLTCHNANHNANGMVSVVNPLLKNPAKR
jgi:predicted CXXCH cytochrome family protein